MNLAPYGRT